MKKLNDFIEIGENNNKIEVKMNPISEQSLVEINNNNLSDAFNNENSKLVNEDLDSNKNDSFLYENDFSLNKKPSIIGNTRNCLFINNYPIISIGKSIFIPLLLILFICIIYIFIYYYFFAYVKTFIQKMFNYFFIGYLVSHLCAIFINPGIPSIVYHKSIKYKLKKNKINELDISKCKICQLLFKLKDKINHCYKCNICYYEQDHHCVWIGHCIGKYNKYFFGLFLFTFIFFNLTCFAMIFIKIIKLLII